MTRPLFSVVTVTLNCADAAEATARTVLAQSYPGIEYLVKDGGSHDGTAERLRAMGANVVVGADTGIYDAMNQALAHCTGEYVYFLNAGDTFAGPDVLAELARRIDTRADVVYGELMLQPMGRRTRHPDRLSRYYLFRKNMNHQAWMARRSAYERFGGLDTRYKFCADQDFIWRARFHARLSFQHVDLTLANFVYGGASTTPRNRQRVADERWQLLRAYFHPLEIAAYGLGSLYFLNPLKVRLRRLQLAARGISYMNMKIAFLARNDGTETRQGKICNSLHALGHELLFIGWDREPEAPKTPTLDPAIPRRIFRWKTGYGEISPSGWPQFFQFVARALRQFQPDVLHVRDEPLAAMVLPLRGLGYKYLVLDIFDSLAAKRYPTPVLNAAALAVRKLAHLGADRIIETSEQLRAMLGPFARKAIVVLNCPADPGEAVARAIPATPAVQICTGGSLSRRRDGLEILLRAVDTLPAGSVEIQASGWLHDDYAREVFVKHPAVRYRWLDTPEEFRAVAASCDAITYLRGDAGVTEYRSWVLPNRFFDAMSVGRPLIISSEMKISRWVAEQEFGYLYRPGDHVALANTIRELRERRTELPAYVDRARRLFTSQYTWGVMEQRLAALYQGLGG